MDDYPTIYQYLTGICPDTAQWIRTTQPLWQQMIGTTRSRVNFFMNKFRKLGFIHYNGGLQVHNSLLSVVLHD